MQNYDELVNELSGLCGIVPEYWDIFGMKHVAPIDTKKAILRAMEIDIDIDSAEEIEKEINRRRWKYWRNLVEPVYVASVNEQPIQIPIYIPVVEGKEAGLRILCSIEDEKGEKTGLKLTGENMTISDVKWIDGVRYIKTNLIDERNRDIGYYKIVVICRHSEKIFPDGRQSVRKKSRLIVSPDACYMPAELEKGRAWGLSINLYAIKSKQNYGIGDFTDLKKIVKWVRSLKGDFVGINPLHAIPNTKSFGSSPYSPISRLYKNFIYLDVNKIPEVSKSKSVGKFMGSKKFKKELNEIKKGDLIDYDKTSSLKEEILRMAFEIFYKKNYTKNTRRGKDFKRHILEEGIALESFALFMVLQERMKKKKNVYTWQDWPKTYRTVSGRAVQSFRKSHAKEIIFYQYLQWLIDTQHKKAAEEAEKAGMSIGLYHDLALSSSGSGSDAWNYRNVIAGDIDLGAPPDDFNVHGQNWGLPPVIPDEMKETGYELFIQTVRKNMRYSGAIRIDHALGLFRLFWIPRGMQPKEGAYVACPSEDLLRIIALESVRNRSIVIAEDLGTIGENVRETLSRFKMLSYRLFYFERNYPDPSFLPPEKYPALALCAATTHDLPTISGYWAGRDIKVRKQLDIFDDEAQSEKAAHERERDKNLILSALKSRGVVTKNHPDSSMIPEMTQELSLAVYKYLSLAPCKLLLISLDDILGTLDQQNMPGTVYEYPNWMQKTHFTLEQMMKDKRFIKLSRMLKRNN